MKTFVALFLVALLSSAFAEPLRYRQAQPVRASAKQTDGGVALQAELGDSANGAGDDQGARNDEGRREQGVTEPSIYQSAPAPYPPRGWVPFGQLLVLPVAVRGNVESTTTVESSTFNESEATEETPTTEQLQEVETSEPKTKLSAAHKRPGGPTIVIIKGKKVGELKVEAKQEAKEEESSETNETTTETADEATTTTNDQKSENLETTSEPDAEAVDVEQSNEEGKQAANPQGPPVPQTGFFLQLPDGSFQRIVYVAPQTPQAQAAFVPQPANIPFQQLNQAPNNPFGYNPITSPRIVTFSTQYNAW